jgi:hypothetical protein
MCAIIIAASKLKVTDVTGFNPLSEDAQDVCGEEMKALQEEINAMKDEHSNGADRMFPFGPTCTFNGITVPNSTKAFAEAAAGCQSAAHVPPLTHVAPSVAATNTSIVAAAGAITVDSATKTAVGAIVVYSAPTVPTSDCQQNAAPSNAPPLDWGEVNPFDFGAHLNMEVPDLPLCFASEDESCSDDDSVFVVLSRD